MTLLFLRTLSLENNDITVPFGPLVTLAQVHLFESALLDDLLDVLLNALSPQHEQVLEVKRLEPLLPKTLVRGVVTL